MNAKYQCTGSMVCLGQQSKVRVKDPKPTYAIKGLTLAKFDVGFLIQIWITFI